MLRGGLRGDGQAVDAEIGADAGDDEEGPAEVRDDGEDEVGAQVPELGVGADSGEADAWEVA